MTKFSVDQGHDSEREVRPPVEKLLPPAQRGDTTCDLYAAGHLIHYKHQGDAVRSPALSVHSALLDGNQILLALEDGTERVWRHHDVERLRRILELLRGKCVVYPRQHALRVGPYWFNCAPEGEQWQDCRVTGDAPPA